MASAASVALSKENFGASAVFAAEGAEADGPSEGAFVGELDSQATPISIRGNNQVFFIILSQSSPRFV
jgi:hypothetical protein